MKDITSEKQTQLDSITLHSNIGIFILQEFDRYDYLNVLYTNQLLKTFQLEKAYNAQNEVIILQSNEILLKDNIILLHSTTNNKQKEINSNNLSMLKKSKKQTKILAVIATAAVIIAIIK